MLISTAARFGDDDDAPEGAVHARVVDATGGWSNTSEHSETFEGASDDAHAGGYLFTLPTEEGLLSCAGASEDASTVAAGTVDGALVAWRRRGGSAGSARSALAEWAGDQGRWPVVDAEVTQEGARCSTGRARATTTRHRWEMESAETVPGPGAEGRCEKKSIVVFGAFGAPRAISKINVRQTADRRV